MSTHPIPQPAPDPLAVLRAEFLDLVDGGASVSDFAQFLDEFLTKRGYPTVLNWDRHRRGRS